MTESSTVAGARKTLGELIAHYRGAAGFGQHAFVDALHAENVFLSRSSIANIERGRQRPGQDLCEAADRLCLAGGELVRAYQRLEVLGASHVQQAQPAPNVVSSGPAVLVDPRGPVELAGHQSLEFLAWAEDDRVSSAVLEHVWSELRRIATDYVHKPLVPLFGDLLVLRDTAFRLLRERPHPRQSRELFFVAGTVCTLLAHASQNLGSSGAARAQAATAWACAEQADHRDLQAWVRGTQALIEEWTDHYDQAVDLAREGQQRAGSADSAVRLAAIEARTLARAGDVAGAVAAVERAWQARDQTSRADALAEFGGVLTFPQVKQLYYAGSTLGLAGRYVEAEQVALEAIHLYETGPAAQRSYGDEALARVDVAVARAANDDLDGAQAALEPVLNLPSGRRIQQIANGLERVRLQLTLPRYAGSLTARELTTDIDGFAEPTEGRSP